MSDVPPARQLHHAKDLADAGQRIRPQLVNVGEPRVRSVAYRRLEPWVRLLSVAVVDDLTAG